MENRLHVSREAAPVGFKSTSSADSNQAHAHNDTSPPDYAEAATNHAATT